MYTHARENKQFQEAFANIVTEVGMQEESPIRRCGAIMLLGYIKDSMLSNQNDIPDYELGMLKVFDVLYRDIHQDIDIIRKLRWDAYFHANNLEWGMDK